MTAVSIVIPYRDRGDGAHAESLGTVTGWLKQMFSGWELIVSDDGRTGDAPWSASTARNRGVASATGRTIVLLDADMWVHPSRLMRAVQLVDDQETPMVQPHQRLLFLSREQSVDYHPHFEPGQPQPYLGSDFDLDFSLLAEPPSDTPPGDPPLVVSRDLYESIPQDPRFQCHVPEGIAWGVAIRLLDPSAWAARIVLPGDAVHFWHPPAPKGTVEASGGMVAPAGAGTDDSPEMRESWRLFRRYADAFQRQSQAEMRALVDEYLPVTTGRITAG